MIEVDSVPGLFVKPLRSDNSPLEEDHALQFVCSLYDKIEKNLEGLLKQREEDRHFIDEKTAELVKKNTPKVAEVWGDYPFIVNYNHKENFEEIGIFQICYMDFGLGVIVRLNQGPIFFKKMSNEKKKRSVLC